MDLIPQPPEPSIPTRQALNIERRRKAGLQSLKQTTIDLFQAFWYPSYNCRLRGEWNFCSGVSFSKFDLKKLAFPVR